MKNEFLKGILIKSKARLFSFCNWADCFQKGSSHINNRGVFLYNTDTWVNTGNYVFGWKHADGLSKKIKNSEYFTSAYPSGIRLEVSSPSIFDPLTEPFQFKKNIGKKIQIKEYSSNFIKTLQIYSVDNAGFNGFEDSDDLFYIRFNEIEKANILVDF